MGAVGKSGLVKEYVQLYKTKPSREIARMLVADNPGVFSGVEEARGYVRSRRGTMGASKRADVDEIIPREYVPAPEMKQLDPVSIPFADFPLCVGGDAHFPYHDEDAVDIFLTECTKAKTIVLLGDWLDFYQASHFIKDPRAMRIADETEMMKEFLAGVRKEFPDKRIIYKIGNHEDRLDTLIKTSCSELYGFPGLDLASAIGAEDSRIEVIPSRQMMKLGPLYALHGHEVGKGVFSPVNPARGLYLKTKKSSICAHYHQTSEHSEKRLDDKVESCWTIGCLCGLKPDYAPVNRWNHGFAVIEHEDEMYTVNNKKIINYRVV